MLFRMPYYTYLALVFLIFKTCFFPLDVLVGSMIFLSIQSIEFDNCITDSWANYSNIEIKLCQLEIQQNEKKM